MKRASNKPLYIHGPSCSLVPFTSEDPETLHLRSPNSPVLRKEWGNELYRDYSRRLYRDLWESTHFPFPTKHQVAKVVEKARPQCSSPAPCSQHGPLANPGPRRLGVQSGRSAGKGQM